MKTWRYDATTKAGKRIKGTCLAEDRAEAAMLLRQKGYIILGLSRHLSLMTLFIGKGRLGSGQKFVMLFVLQLSRLLHAAVPLNDCLHFLTHSQKTKAGHQSLSQLQQAVCEGMSLSDAMRLLPGVFSPTVRAITRAGEKSGHMDEALNNLSDYLVSQYELKQMLQQAIIYPALLVIVSILIVSALMVIAVPAIADQLTQSGLPLPASTRLLISTSTFLSDNLTSLLLSSITGTGLFFLSLKHHRCRYSVDSLLLKLPLCGGLIRATQISVLLMTLSILTRFTIPVLESLNITLEAIYNLRIKTQLRDACLKISEGESIYHALVRARLLDDTSLMLLAAGEKSGDFPQMVKQASELLQKEIQGKLASLLKLLEPLLILIIGGIVLFIFMAIMQPMLQLNDIPL